MRAETGKYLLGRKGVCCGIHLARELVHYGVKLGQHLAADGLMAAHPGEAVQKLASRIGALQLPA